MNLSAAAIERFWSKVDRTDSCWLWQGGKSKGYGMFTVRIGGRSVTYRAHRVAWYLHTGREPALLDHACRVRSCVNPDHIRPLTNAENVLIGIGPTAINARKTSCASGHEFTPENTRWRADGARQCRACTRIWAANKRARKRGAVA